MDAHAIFPLSLKCSAGIFSFRVSLVNQLERELDLPGVTCGFADQAKATGSKGVGWEAHGDDIEEIEELAAELQIYELGSAFANAQRRVFDEGKVEIIEGGSAEGVAANCAETSLVRPCSAGQVNRNIEKVSTIVCAVAKVVFAHLARG